MMSPGAALQDVMSAMEVDACGFAWNTERRAHEYPGPRFLSSCEELNGCLVHPDDFDGRPCTDLKLPGSLTDRNGKTQLIEHVGVESDNA